MTDRINHLTVVLDQDIRVDDAQILIDAISMFRHVIHVERGIPSDIHTLVAKEQLKRELRTKVLDVFQS